MTNAWFVNSLSRKRARIQAQVDAMLTRGRLDAFRLYQLTRELEALHAQRDEHESGG